MTLFDDRQFAAKSISGRGLAVDVVNGCPVAIGYVTAPEREFTRLPRQRVVAGRAMSRSLQVGGPIQRQKFVAHDTSDRASFWALKWRVVYPFHELPT